MQKWVSFSVSFNPSLSRYTQDKILKCLGKMAVCLAFLYISLWRFFCVTWLKSCTFKQVQCFRKSQGGLKQSNIREGPVRNTFPFLSLLALATPLSWSRILEGFLSSRGALQGPSIDLFWNYRNSHLRTFGPPVRAPAPFLYLPPWTSPPPWTRPY